MGKRKIEITKIKEDLISEQIESLSSSRLNLLNACSISLYNLLSDLFLIARREMKCLFDIELDKNFIRFDIAIENCFVDRGIDERSSERSGCISKCLIYLLALRRLI